MGRALYRHLPLALSVSAVILCLLSCSEDGSGTGPAGPTGPSVAELTGNWYSSSIGLDEALVQSDTTVIADTSWLFQVTDTRMIDHYLAGATGSCYCADTLEYTGVSGDTVLGEDLTGYVTMTGFSWYWTTTYAMEGEQLVLTIRQNWQTTYSSSEGSYTTDTTSTLTIYHAPLDGGFPAWWPSNKCLGCGVLYKQRGLAKEPMPSDGELRKGGAADDMIGLWHVVKMIERVETDDEWRAVNSDTIFAVTFDSDSAVVYDLSEQLAGQCYATARDTFDLQGELLLGNLFAGTLDQGTDKAEWSTTCSVDGNTLTLVFTVTESWRQAGSGVSSGGSYTQVWTVDLFSTNGPMPPNGWPSNECSQEWSLYKSAADGRSPLFDLLDR